MNERSDAPKKLAWSDDFQSLPELRILVDPKILNQSLSTWWSKNSCSDTWIVCWIKFKRIVYEQFFLNSKPASEEGRTDVFKHLLFI